MMASRPIKSTIDHGILQRVNSCPCLLRPDQDLKSASEPASPPPPPTTTTRRHTVRFQHMFTAEDRAYLRSRLPLHQPVTPGTAAAQLARLPRVYLSLAEGCRARAASLPAECHRERLRRLRMADLAERLAKRYAGFRLVLPPSYIAEAVVRLRRLHPRASRFWDKLLDEVERANNVWSIVRLWTVLLIIHSTLVASAFTALTSLSTRLALLGFNVLACVWSVTVMFDMLRARYTAVNADEQELHDLIGDVNRGDEAHGQREPGTTKTSGNVLELH